MRKFIALVVFFALFSISAPVLALDAPTLTVTTSGINVSLFWTSVPNATGYTLFYAPYPDASYIEQIDMGTETSISFDLSEGAAFYVAVKAYNSSGSSEYSNIEYFELSVSFSYTIANNGETFILETGDTATVTLSSNPTTGYGWGIKALDETVFNNTGNTYISSCQQNSDIAGCGGEEVWSFEAMASGLTTLEMVYFRPWEGQDSAIDTFWIEVQIQ